MIEQTCDKCGLCQTRTSVVPSLVPETTEVLFVLSFPGEAEDLEGKGPFVGNVGKFLNDLLYSIGLTRTDPRLGFTYAVRCRPKETNEEKIRQGRRDRLPSDIELKACSDYLEQEISSLSNLKLIVCLGSTASKRIIGSTGAQYDSLIGKVVNTLYAKALFMFHPSKLSSTTSHKERAELEAKASTAMSYVKGVLQGVVQKPLRKPVTYRVIRNVEQAKWLFDKLSSSEVFSFDLETSALDFLESHVLCISLSFKEQTGYVLPFYKQYLVPFWDSDEDYNFIYSRIKSILENSSLKKIGHNGKFDILHLRSFGINVKGYYFDTMLMHFALDENSSHGLKELSWSYTDMGGYDDELEEIRNKIKDERGISYREVSFDLLPEEKMWEYAAADADVTLRLFNIFFPRLKEENLLDLYSVYYRPMVEMLSDIEYRGITIDLEYLDSAITFYEDKVKALESQLLEDPYIKEYIEEKREVYRAERAKKWEVSKTLSRRYSVKDYCEIGIDSITFNSNSPKQLIEFFIHKMKQPILATTEKNSPSINNEVLKVYAKKLPVASILSSKNQASHILGTSLEGMKKRLRRDNKLHTSFNMHVAVTARLCVAGDTKLDTNQGSFEVSELQLTKDIEHTIFTHTGKPRRILNKFYKGREEMFKVQLDNDNFIVCTRGHRLLTPGGWKHVRDLSSGDTVCSYIYSGSSTRLLSQKLICSQDTQSIGREEFYSHLSLRRFNSISSSTEVSNNRLGLFCEQNLLEASIQGGDETSKSSKSFKSFEREYKSCKRSHCNHRQTETSRPSRARIKLSCFIQSFWSKRIHSKEKPSISQYQALETFTRENAGNRSGLFRQVRTLCSRNKVLSFSLLFRPKRVLQYSLFSILKSSPVDLVYKGSRFLYDYLSRGRKTREKSCMLGFKSIRNVVVNLTSRFTDISYSTVSTLQELHGGLLLPTSSASCRDRWVVSCNNFEGIRHYKREIYEREQDNFTENSSREVLERPKPICFENTTATISSIEPVGVKDVWDIEVDEDHSYCAQGLIHHNSSSDPNLQNVPNKGRFPEDSERVRNIFVADPDCFILEADYGQIEFRMWAQLSQDPALYKDLRDGLDVHTKFAAMGFNIPESEVTKPLRNTAKNVVFGTMYGRSPESVAEELEISNREAISIQKALFNRYPQAVKWINVSKASAKRDGYVTGFFGQRRRLAQQLSDARRFIRSEAERQSVNSPIQGSSSQMTCVAAIKIFQGIRESNFNPSTRILLLIHDSIVLNIHKNDAKECLDLVERCMLNPHPGVTVPLTVGMNYSVRWGKAKELSKDEIFECVKRDFTI